MKYQIVYVSQTGNTELISNGVRGLFPARDTRTVNLALDTPSLDADVYLVGFGMNRGTIPLQIMDLLEHLKDKTILFLITCGMEPTEEYRREIWKKLLPFMPDRCDCRGIFLCPGSFPAQLLSEAKAAAEADPSMETHEGKRAHQILQEAELSSGHPNIGDMGNACNFVRRHLGME